MGNYSDIKNAKEMFDSFFEFVYFKMKSPSKYRQFCEEKGLDKDEECICLYSWLSQLFSNDNSIDDNANICVIGMENAFKEFLLENKII